MPERTNRQRFSNLLAQALRHWGHTPFYIFDLADDGGLVYTDKTGTIRLTKNGDPQVVDSLVDDEGKALEFDGVDDYVWFPSSKVDFLADMTTSWTVGGVANPNTSGDEVDMLFATKTSGKDGVIIVRENRNATDQLRAIPESQGGKRDLSTSDNVIPADQTTSWNLTHDTQDFYLSADGTRLVSASSRNKTSTNSADQAQIGNQPGTSRFYHGAQSFVYITENWSTEIQNTALHNWQQDRDNQPTIPTQLPDYLEPHQGDIEFWHTTDRDFRYIDGEGVEQLTDHSGNNFLAQRSGSNQPIARGPTNRTDPLNHLEYNGHQWHRIEGDTKSSGWTVAVLVNIDDSYSSNTMCPVRLENKETGNLLILPQYDSGIIECYADDGSGVRGSFSTSNVDTTIWNACVITADFGNDKFRVVAEDNNGNTDTYKNAPGYGTDATLDYGAVGRNEPNTGRELYGKLKEPIILNKPLTDTEQDNLLSELTKKFP